MSYYEYNDLYIKAQKNKNAPYVCFSFDLVKSRQIGDDKFFEQQKLMIKTMKDIVEFIQIFEHKKHIRILLNDNNVKINKTIIGSRNKDCYANPNIICGDFYAFYFYNNTITKNDFINLFLHYARKNNLNFDYHFQSAKFETTSYENGNTEYFLGYCVSYLQNHKSKTIISVKNQQNIIEK